MNSEAYLGGGVGLTFNLQGDTVTVKGADAYSDETVTVTRADVMTWLGAVTARRDVSIQGQASWGPVEIRHRPTATGAGVSFAGAGETPHVELTFRRRLDEPVLARALLALMH